VVGVNDGRREVGGSGSEEENCIGVGFGTNGLELFGALPSLNGLLDIVEQPWCLTSGTGLVQWERSDLVGQSDGLDWIGGQERVEMLNLSLAVVELCGEIGEETGDEAGTEDSPDGPHVILIDGRTDR
jgi:hypothetical protein